MKIGFCFTLALVVITSYLTVNGQQTANITNSGIGYLEYLPEGYDANSNNYPVVIFLHGVNEKGSSSDDPKKIRSDLKKVAHFGLPKYVKSGQKYPFILISPQLKDNYTLWPPTYVMDVIKHVKTKLRIEEKRIYLTGLSLGGMGVWKTVGEYPEIFAAIAPICPGGNALNKASEIAAANVAVWGFHGSKDDIARYTVTTTMINALNSSPKRPNPLAKVTIFPGMGHGVWDKAYLETDVLSWMLTFRKGRPSSDNSNSPPVVNAGPDTTLAFPVDSVFIEGTASDTDGTIASYQWTKVSGGNAHLIETTSPTLHALDLTHGIYVFRLTAKDKGGAAASDDVQVTVRSSDNIAPSVNAGEDITLTWPANATNLPGTATDTDGEIVSYFWTKVSGGEANLSGIETSQLNVSNLAEGSYVFKLVVTDNDGATATDEVMVSVIKTSAENIPPVVDAGSELTLRLPANSVSIQGSAMDEDGSITSYKWVQISGPSATLSESTSQTVTVSNLQEGTYVFRFSAQDDTGARSADDVKITVIKGLPGNIIPVDYNGPDRSTNLPTNLQFNLFSVEIPVWFNNGKH